MPNETWTAKDFEDQTKRFLCVTPRQNQVKLLEHVAVKLVSKCSSPMEAKALVSRLINTLIHWDTFNNDQPIMAHPEIIFSASATNEVPPVAYSGNESKEIVNKSEEMMDDEEFLDADDCGVQDGDNDYTSTSSSKKDNRKMCPKCPTLMSKRHWLRHGAEGSHKCGLCDYVANNNAGLSHHVRSHDRALANEPRSSFSRARVTKRATSGLPSVNIVSESNKEQKTETESSVTGKNSNRRTSGRATRQRPRPTGKTLPPFDSSVDGFTYDNVCTKPGCGKSFRSPQGFKLHMNYHIRMNLKAAAADYWYPPTKMKLSSLPKKSHPLLSQNEDASSAFFELRSAQKPSAFTGSSSSSFPSTSSPSSDSPSSDWVKNLLAKDPRYSRLVQISMGSQNEPTFFCTKCQFFTSSATFMYKNHVPHHLNNLRYTCPGGGDCGFSAISDEEIRYHMTAHHRPPLDLAMFMES